MEKPKQPITESKISAASKPEKLYKIDQPEIFKIVESAWARPVGKVILFALGGLTVFCAVGPLFKVGAYTVNSYKDFRDACKR
jgi:hypothetical protein